MAESEEQQNLLKDELKQQSTLEDIESNSNNLSINSNLPNDELKNNVENNNASRIGTKKNKQSNDEKLLKNNDGDKIATMDFENQNFEDYSQNNEKELEINENEKEDIEISTTTRIKNNPNDSNKSTTTTISKRKIAKENKQETTTETVTEKSTLTLPGEETKDQTTTIPTPSNSSSSTTKSRKATTKNESPILNYLFIGVVCLIVLFMLIAIVSIWRYGSPSRPKLGIQNSNTKTLKPAVIVEFEPHMACYKDSILHFLNDELSYVARFFERHSTMKNLTESMVYVLQALSPKSEKNFHEKIVPKRKLEGAKNVFLLNIRFNPAVWKESTSTNFFELACSAETGNIHQDLPFNEKSIDEFGKNLFQLLHPNSEKTTNNNK